MLISYSATKLAIIVGKSTILHQKNFFFALSQACFARRSIINFRPFTVA